ncbi:MAG: tRNA pseudouridine(13) synthase TruD [Candidatus Micrarchaeota archaeon]|nr:tRNA pseudouridine(13) synthase TruD [Candidatus Micrarchaeota archaeon]
MSLAYLSKSEGIGGRIKETPEDFIVEEISQDGRIFRINEKINGGNSGSNGGGIFRINENVTSESTSAEDANSEGGNVAGGVVLNFAHFVLQKRNWDTLGALREVGRRNGRGIKAFGYAGTKDRVAVTTQLCSAHKIAPEALLTIKAKDIAGLGAWKAGKKIEMGELGGNKFKIVVRGVEKQAEEKVKEIADELENKFPNYFGEQRFGSRGNNHLVGKFIMLGDLRGAAMEYLCGGNEEKNELARKARKELHESEDFKTALENFPKHLRYERAVLAHLAEKPKDYANAMRKLPRGISLMFVHAYQSHLFNLCLSEKIGKGGVGGNETDAMGTIIGYDSGELDGIEAELLEKEGMRKEDFRIRPLPELSSKGTRRRLLEDTGNLNFGECEDGIRLEFELKPGCYATSVLREFMKNEKAGGGQEL